EEPDGDLRGERGRDRQAKVAILGYLGQIVLSVQKVTPTTIRLCRSFVRCEETMVRGMLYDDLFIRLERARWQLSKDIPFDDIDPSLVTPQWIHDLRHICLTELSALYATEMF